MVVDCRRDRMIPLVYVISEVNTFVFDVIFLDLCPASL